MKTTTIFKTTAAILAMFVIMLFAINGCSDDDDSDDSNNTDGYTAGQIIPAADFPSIRIPGKQEISGDAIGYPIYSGSKLHNYEFHVIIDAVQSNEWIFRGYRSSNCTWPLAVNYVNENYWSYNLPKQYFSWDNSSIFCYYHSGTYYLGWDEAIPLSNGTLTRKLIEEQEWSYFPIVGAILGRLIEFDFDGSNYQLSSWYRLPDPPPPLYMSMERNWVPSNDKNEEIYSEGFHTHIISTTTGVLSSTRHEFSTTLGLSADAEIEAIDIGVSKTWKSTDAQAMSFKKDTTETRIHEFTVPSGQEWRYITFNGVETFYFSDENGNRWESNNLIIRQPLGVSNAILKRTLLVKYSTNSSKAYSAEVIGGEDFE